jgi:hypothetical protein
MTGSSSMRSNHSMPCCANASQFRTKPTQAEIGASASRRIIGIERFQARKFAGLGAAVCALGYFQAMRTQARWCVLSRAIAVERVMHVLADDGLRTRALWKRLFHSAQLSADPSNRPRSRNHRLPSPKYAACPMNLVKLLTDNGKEFTDRLFASREREGHRTA